MEIPFNTKKLERAFSSIDQLRREYGTRAETISIRIAVLKNAQTLAMVPTNRPERLHQLAGNRRGQFSVDVGHPYRMILRPSVNPIPRNPDGGIELARVTAVTIVGVIDYH